MARDLFAGGEMDSFHILSGSPVEVTTAGLYDSSYARCATQIPNSSAVAQGYFIDSADALDDVVTGETLWFHAEVYLGGSASGSANMIELIDVSTGFPYLAFRTAIGGAAATCGIYGNTGTGASPSWTLLGSTTALGESSRKVVDIKWILGSPHSCELYMGGNLAASGTFTQASATAIGGFKLKATSGSNACSYSQIYAREGATTVGAKIISRTSTGAGTTDTFTSGSASDVNETVYSDATAMISDTADQIFTLAYDDVTVPTGYTIQSVFVWSRGKNDGTAPTNFQAAVRRSGTDYFSSNTAGIGVGYMPLGAQFDVDPSTSAAWTEAGFNAAEIGGKSIT